MHAHGQPLTPGMRETIDLWVSDFADRPAFRAAQGGLEEQASQVLTTFLESACHGGHAPAEIDEHDVSHALLDHLPSLELSPRAKAEVPGLVAAFLGDLEDVGRLAGGHSLAARVRAATPAYRERARGQGPDLRRQAPKVGRNDPCPCGSGKKYKTCCLNLLG